MTCDDFTVDITEDTPIEIDIGDDDISVNIDGQGLVYWGNILGTLSNQTDLQNALNLKLNITDFSSYFDSNFSTKTTDDLTEGVTNLYDQIVTLTEGSGITITGTYPNFTITNSASGDTTFL